MPSAAIIADVVKLAQDLRGQFGSLLRVVVIGDAELADVFGFVCYRDADGAFAKTYGHHNTMFLVRPDGYIGWRGQYLNSASLMAHLTARLGDPAGCAMISGR